MTTMRAKVTVSSITKMTGAERVVFNAVSKCGGYPDDGSDEDNSFARWSPSASFDITIANPDLFGAFKHGDRFYVDFTPAV